MQTADVGRTGDQNLRCEEVSLVFEAYQHVARMGAALPVGGSIRPCTETRDREGRQWSSRLPDAATTSVIALVSSGLGPGAFTATVSRGSAVCPHPGVTRSGPCQGTGRSPRQGTDLDVPGGIVVEAKIPPIEFLSGTRVS